MASFAQHFARRMEHALLEREFEATAGVIKGHVGTRVRKRKRKQAQNGTGARRQEGFDDKKEKWARSRGKRTANPAAKITTDSLSATVRKEAKMAASAHAGSENNFGTATERLRLNERRQALLLESAAALLDDDGDDEDDREENERVK